MNMQIFVTDLSGETLVIDSNNNDSIINLKSNICHKIGYPNISDILLKCGGRTLIDTDYIEDTIIDGSSVYMSLALLGGGGKKKKKKVHAKPKKIKHKKKKVKLAVLKFYKVDSSEKVTRMRRVCPGPDCGPGVFMSTHYNRYYCGRCALSYLINEKST
eukprot:GHVL01017211.1.p1 GENE.GHVL01017211.1~~GHVL01017211.1.p1  ORF type:complete len:159 (+),score=41.89 GHVL01017211.1:62-538(+)